jgi:hypothetical protein
MTMEKYSAEEAKKKQNKGLARKSGTYISLKLRQSKLAQAQTPTFA